MSKVLVDGAGAWSRHWPRVVVPLLLCLVAMDAMAQSEEARPSFGSQAIARGFDDRTRPQFEVSASSLPRFENFDGATRTSRLDMSLLPAGRSSLGLALGVTSLDGLSLGNTAGVNNSPSIDLGFHWRYTTDSNNRVDVRAWRRMPQPDALSLIQNREPTYGARVEMQVSSLPKSGFIAERGFVGVQLESGANITLKRSGGKPMLYYRSKF